MLAPRAGTTACTVNPDIGSGGRRRTWRLWVAVAISGLAAMRGVVRRRLSSAGVEAVRARKAARAQAVTRMIGAGTIEDVAVPALPKEYAMHYPPRTVPFAERHVDLLEDVFRDLKSVKKREQDLLTEPAPDPEHARARWPDRPEVRELLQRSDLAIGDVIEPRRPDPYDAAAGPDQFRDVTPPLPGTVPAHANLVDIGFTDFGALLDMDFQSEFADSKWLGVDLCPFNCAKTRVMLEMMRVKHCTGQEIMEVWPRPTGSSALSPSPAAY